MMRRALFLAAVGLLALVGVARADVAVTAGSGTTIFDFTCFTTKHCPAAVVVNSAGTEILTSSNPGTVTGSGTAGTAATGVLTVQGIASMTKLLVTPDANSAVNMAQVAGTTADTNSGTKSAGTLRVVLATDQPALTNKLLVTPDLPSGASTAAKQPALGTAGSASTDVISVQGIASMTPMLVNPGTAANWGVGATGSAVPANGAYQGVNVAGNLRGITGLSLGTTFSPTVAIVDASGNQITAFGGSGGTASNFGSAFPSSGTAIGLSDGTNMRGWLNAANALNSTGTGIGTAQIVGQFDDVAPTAITENQFGNLRMSTNRNLYGTIRDAAGNERGVNVNASNQMSVSLDGGTGATVTANAGTNLNTSALALESGGNLATVAGHIVSQGTALGTIKNALIGGSVTTASPTYTTGQINPLSLDTSGNLRVNVVTGGTSGVVTQGSTTSGQSGMMVQGAVTTSAPTYTTAQTNPLSLTTAGGLRTDTATLAGTAVATNSGNKDGGTARVVIATDQPALTNAQPGNFTQIGGVSVSTGTGAVGTGSQRVAVGTDTATIAGSAPGTAGTASTNVISVQGIASMTKLLVTPDANSAVNLAQVAGTTTSVTSGNKDNGTQRVAIATDDVAHATWGQGATGSAPPSGAVYMGANGSGATGGQMRGLITCDSHAKYDASDNGSITMVTGVSSRKVYICGFILATGGTATNLKLREGSDANCATSGADLTPAYQLVANDKIGMQSPFWGGLVVSTNAYYVCVNASAGNAHQAELWYTIL